MSENVWVIVPMLRGHASPVALELLKLGHELATKLGEHVCAVCWGHEIQDQLHDLNRADQILCIEHAHLANATPDVCASVLDVLARSKQPRCILVPSTNETWELMGELPERLGAPLTNFCIDVRIVEDGIEATSLLYGGKVRAVTLTRDVPAVFGVLPGSRTVHTIPPGPQPEIDVILPSVTENDSMRLCRYIDPEVGDVDISKQAVLISVGRGIVNEANVGIAEELANALGGVVCGSRPIIDQGWLPLSRQVGKSGVHVKPRLYLMAGVSGTPEHVEGMKNSGLVIAINTDPDAPIFNVAHYGIVGDAVEMMEAMVESMRATAGG